MNKLKIKNNKKAQKNNKKLGADKKSTPGNKKVRVGQMIHSNDKYFYKTDGMSKNRESVVIEKNQFEELAIVKITTKKNKNTKGLPNYNKKTYFDKRNLYIQDDEGNFIKLSNSNKLDKHNKFVKSNFPNMSEKDVRFIKQGVLSDEKYGKRNKNRLNKIKKRK